jgi:hypothetical protein
VTDYTPASWAAALLAKLGLPTTSPNLTAITAWENAEGGNWHNSDAYNPLNTTQSAPGAVATNSAGVKAYTSWDQGLTATVQTLTNGMYGGILAALSKGSSADDVVSAVVKSPWGTKNISLDGASVTAPAGDGTAVQAGLPSLTSVPTYLTKILLTVAFVGGGGLLVVLGLMRGTTVGRQASNAYGNHLKEGAKLAATVA